MRSFHFFTFLHTLPLPPCPPARRAEQEYGDLARRKAAVERDRAKIAGAIAELDRKKADALAATWAKVNRSAACMRLVDDASAAIPPSGSRWKKAFTIQVSVTGRLTMTHNFLTLYSEQSMTSLQGSLEIRRCSFVSPRMLMYCCGATVQPLPHFFSPPHSRRFLGKLFSCLLHSLVSVSSDRCSRPVKYVVAYVALIGCSGSMAWRRRSTGTRRWGHAFSIPAFFPPLQRLWLDFLDSAPGCQREADPTTRSASPPPPSFPSLLLPPLLPLSFSLLSRVVWAVHRAPLMRSSFFTEQLSN